MERTHSGSPAGVGAIYAWKSESGKVGQGRMTIERSEPPTLVELKLEFIKPFAAANAIRFTTTPTVAGSTVTWAMDGRNGFVAKGFALAMDMNKMVGGDFERGLANLKTVVEAALGPGPTAAGEPATK